MAVVLSPITVDEVDAVQAIIEADPGYVERVTGLQPGPADGQSLLMMRPPGIAANRKTVFGIRRDRDLIGLLDVVRGYPDEHTAYVGLLQIRADLQRRGFGRQAHEALLRLVASWSEIRTLRLAVVTTNSTVAEPFWRRLGYRPFGDPVPHAYASLETTAQRFELRLAPRGQPS